MVMVVNFRDRPTEVDVGRAVDPVITIGQIEVIGDVVQLGPHSAMAADTTERRELDSRTAQFRIPERR